MSSPSLLDMPDLVMDKILAKCGFVEIHTLRKVCHDLRNYIEDKKPEAKLNGFSLSVYPNYISMTYYDSFNPILVEYREFADGCFLRYKDKGKILKDLKFRDAFIQDFQIILKYQKANFKTAMIKTMAFPVFENFEISVENFEIYANQDSEVVSILRHLQPKILKNISIYVRDLSDRSSLEPLEMSRIIVLDQWKKAEECYISRMIEAISLDNFAHFLSGFVLVQTIDSNGLLGLKESFLASLNLKRFVIQHIIFNDKDHFMDAMGPVHEYFGRQKWFFKCRSSRCLSVFYDSPNNQITFSKIDLSEVPANAVIQ